MGWWRRYPRDFSACYRPWIEKRYGIRADILFRFFRFIKLYVKYEAVRKIPNNYIDTGIFERLAKIISADKLVRMLIKEDIIIDVYTMSRIYLRCSIPMIIAARKKWSYCANKWNVHAYYFINNCKPEVIDIIMKIGMLEFRKLMKHVHGLRHYQHLSKIIEDFKNYAKIKYDYCIEE